MTFDSREQSIFGGAPIQLFIFSLGGKTWRYCRYDTRLTIDGHEYLPLPIESGKIRQSSDVKRMSMTIKVPRDFPIAELWRVSPASGTVLCFIKDAHFGETEVRTVWVGHVANVTWPSEATVQIQLDPGIVTLNATGLRRVYQKNCPHVVYGPGCEIEYSTLRETAELSVVSGVTIQSALFATHVDGWWSGGFIQWLDSSGVTEWRWIVSHVGDTVTLNIQAPQLSAGMQVDAHPGCDHTISTCSSKFGNDLRFGGMPYMTNKNPFTGSPIF